MDIETLKRRRQIIQKNYRGWSSLMTFYIRYPLYFSINGAFCVWVKVSLLLRCLVFRKVEARDW